MLNEGEKQIIKAMDDDKTKNEPTPAVDDATLAAHDAAAEPKPTDATVPPTPPPPAEPTVSDEEIDAYLLRPLSNPLEDDDVSGADSRVGAQSAPTPPPRTAGSTPPFTPPAPPRPGAAYPPKRLYRDPHGKIGGVASGLAHYFNIDVAIVRLILILLTLSFLPLPIYIAAWIAIPKAPTWPPPGPPQRVRSGRLDSRTLAAAGLLVGVIVIASAAGSGPGAVIVPVILVAVGMYLLNQPERVSQGAAVGGDGTVDPSIVSSANYSPYEPATLASTPPAWAYETTAPALEQAPPRRRRRLWPLLLLPLIPIAMVAGGAIAATSARDTTVTFGEATYQPTSVAAIDDSYSHSFGSVTIDFSSIDFTDEEVDTRVKNAFGETYIVVPDDVHVMVEVENSMGDVEFFGETAEGISDFQRVREGSNGRLLIEIDNSFGEVRFASAER